MIWVWDCSEVTHLHETINVFLNRKCSNFFILTKSNNSVHSRVVIVMHKFS